MSGAAVGDYSVEVAWGDRKFMVQMRAAPEDTGRPLWWGQLGSIQIREFTTILGNRTAYASTPVCEALDPGPFTAHHLSGGYHDDVPAAVAGLYATTNQVVDWLAQLPERTAASDGGNI